MSSGRFAVFLVIVLSVWTLLHLYLIWRIGTIPVVVRHLPRWTLIAIIVLLWLSYPLARYLSHAGVDSVARTLEHIGADWIGVIFLLFVVLLVTDVITGFGLWLSRAAPTMRGWGLLAGCLLAVIGFVQGLRPPVVRDYEVTMPGLPAERNGTVLVAVSDLHLGSLLGEKWLAARIATIESLTPDLVVFAGDILEGDVRVDREFGPMVPILRRLTPPLGVWAVTGNHEYYSGVEPCVHLLESAGMQVLRDRWAEACPGLVVAGVDDLTARRQFARDGDPVGRALAGRPTDAATIFISHTPWLADSAAHDGVGLMLSGHTHDGQIWPFGYFVQLTYPLMGGRYEIGTMPVIVCRGTGTWGPRLRLWRPSEIVRVVLRAPTDVGS
ncbi:MAG: metallophosphoesterase [Candidatus Zixiibacteriota bacterium]